MAQQKAKRRPFSRRALLGKLRWAPALFLPAPIFKIPLDTTFLTDHARFGGALEFSDFRLTPRYLTKSPLDDVLRKVAPGSDEYVTEKYAFEIKQLLGEWSLALKSQPPAIAALGRFVDDSLKANSMAPIEQTQVRSANGIDVIRRKFSSDVVERREQFLGEMKTYFASLSLLDTAEFEMTSIEEIAAASLIVRAGIRYEFAGTGTNAYREARVGHWMTQWSRDATKGWRALRWEATGETVSRAASSIFVDVTSQALGQTESYKKQMIHGVDYWRTVLDGACGIDVYGNNGLAAGDFDNDGYDDLYVCQPPGLPNRLYRNRGDGTFEDVTEKAGVGVLDGTACALFADFANKGLQDLLVVCGSGPLLFVNQGNGKFEWKRDAFQFAKPPQGTFTHAAVADYDRDGRLDIYFCLYSYYQGLEQYQYPAPYFDARNGPPNFLLHNEGNAVFRDRTETAGLNVDNDRYSFACAWGDYNSDGAPDLYVANDFGRSNLYRNDGTGKFTAVSAEAGVEDVGAGMSATWLDFDNDGNQDVYVSNMWSAAGMRVSEQQKFHEKEPEDIRALYRQHARGNSLYRNQGNGKFRNVSREAGVDLGRWAWSSDAWDFDHDGHSDLYVANGYISGPKDSAQDTGDVASFFWRQVVANSPQSLGPAANYELGWNAINELIRSDSSWNGYERNVLYTNNHDGTFSDISGISGLDLPDDSRSFAFADLDHDGRLEVILKNRNGPQIRVLRNAMKDLGSSIAFRLRGTKSNRDAIGAAIMVEAEGLRQTKYVQAGSGFLSQHSKELFFGIGKNLGTVRATIRWPSGLSQVLERVPVNRRIEIEEGLEDFATKPFGSGAAAYLRAGDSRSHETSPSTVETWLVQPLCAPEFSLPGLGGTERTLRSLRGGFVLLNFWTTASPGCSEQLRAMQKQQSSLNAGGLHVLSVNLNDSSDSGAVREFAARERLSLPILLGTQEVAGIYNIIYRYLFDRRRALPLPISFLVDADGLIVKVYQGVAIPDHVLEDVKSAPANSASRVKKALPFDGTLYQEQFQRNDFTYGVAMFQRGYLDQAAESFRQVITAKPQEPEAYYNLGTLYLRKNALSEARRFLEQTVQLRRDYPEAWNNLGMIAGQEGKSEEAIRNFQTSLSLRPGYVTALLNLGNLYRRQGASDEAQKLLNRALEIEPDNPEASYSLGMLYARQNKLQPATDHLEKAVALRPDYSDALNNLGVLFVRQERYTEAKERFESCIRLVPSFDQAYLNLARLYVVLNEKEKAKDVLQALLRLQPDHKLARQALEMLN